MNMKQLALAVLAIGLSEPAAAQCEEISNVAQYCATVHQQIITLVNSVAKANDEPRTLTSDQADRDSAKLANANLQLNLLARSLHEKELEWYHLGCVQILYRRPAK